MEAGLVRRLTPLDGVDLYAAELDLAAVAPADAALLDPAERRRAADYRRPADAARFSAGRALLRRLLADYLAMPPERVPLVVDGYGRPSVEGGTRQFSLSYSGRLVIVAIGPAGRLGVDVERRDERLRALSLARRFFGPEEADFVAAGADGLERVDRFLRLWTLKEAYLKAVGTGLYGHLARWQFAVEGHEPRLACPVGGDDAAHWRFREFEPAAGYLAALASGR